MAGIDMFFNLGNKATRGDPLRKAQFDYYLYWVLFLAFASLAITYFYNFFFDDAPINQLFWGLIMLVIGWFNYFGLIAFRNAYMGIKSFRDAQNLVKDKQCPKDENVQEMLALFNNK
jgi:hypothetical protein